MVFKLNDCDVSPEIVLLLDLISRCMTRKQIASAVGEGEKNKTIKDKKSAVICKKKSGFVLSLRSVYFVDYMAGFKQVSRDTESDSAQRLRC